MSSTQLSDIYTDGYQDLRKQARTNSPEAVRQVAQQFEAYFLQQVLRESQKTMFPDPYFDPKSYEVYRDMLHQQLALGMSRTGRFGFAEMIERQLANVTPANREVLSWQGGANRSNNAPRPTPACFRTGVGRSIPLCRPVYLYARLMTAGGRRE